MGTRNNNYMEVLAMPNRRSGEHSQEWHARRRSGIGGSDSAAVLGESKWRTPYAVWAQKTGRAAATPPNTAMKAGTALEKVIREMYSNETGRTVYDPGFAVDEECPIIVGDVDGLCDDRVLEIKNSRYEWDEIPVDYFFQCQHYMRLFNKPFADLAVLFSGQDFRIFTIEAQPELWEMIIPVYREFWRCVETDTPPELETLADVNNAYRQSRDSSIVLNAQTIESVRNIQRLKDEIKELEMMISDLEFIVKKDMADNAVGTDANGKTIVTWKTSKPRTSFNSKQFQIDQPELYQQYLTTGSPSRTFLIK